MEQPAVHDWGARTLREHRYGYRAGRPAAAYIAKLTSLSRAQVDHLICRYGDVQDVQEMACLGYRSADIHGRTEVLAEVDAPYET